MDFHYNWGGIRLFAMRRMNITRCRGEECCWIYFSFVVLFIASMVSSTDFQFQNRLEHDCHYVNSFLRGKFHEVSTVYSLPRNCCQSCKFVKCASKSVSELDFSSLGLTGTMINITAIWNLRNLTRLDLSNNLLTGNIPSEIWDFPMLQYLNLSLNNFHGNLVLNKDANYIGGGVLETLDISNNNLEGPLSAFCLRFQNLLFLNASFNNFTHFGPFLGYCNPLFVLDASFNKLQGELPTNIKRLDKLRRLDVLHNCINGRICKLSNLLDLQVLDISFNNNSPNGTVHPNHWKGFELLSFHHKLLLKARLYISSNGAPLSGGSRRNRTVDVGNQNTSCLGAAAIAGMVGGSLLFIIIIIVVAFSFCKRWVIRKPPFSCNTKIHIPEVGGFSFETDSGTWVADVRNPNRVPIVIFEKPLISLTFDDLLQATASFDKLALVSIGDGPVYRCVLPGLLPGDEQIAIKVLAEGRHLTDEEAVNRFETMGMIKHANIVPLLGYCIVGTERLLIYKFMQNGKLHDWLHDVPDRNVYTEDWSLDTWEQKTGEELGARMGWVTRYKIALGVARALTFLHDGFSSQIIHGNISSNTILLDKDFEPQLWGYRFDGLDANDVYGRRENGYTAPEYGSSTNYTTRGDVYSFGLVLLELVTGKKPLGDHFPYHESNSLVSAVHYLIEEKRGIRALDPKLINLGPVTEMLETLRIGYLCTSESPRKRPDMRQVVGLLKDIVPSHTTYYCTSAQG